MDVILDIFKDKSCLRLYIIPENFFKMYFHGFIGFPCTLFFRLNARLF